MAWEERGGRRFYYRKRRTGKQVVSQYIGVGSFADACAKLDALDKQRVTAERRLVTEERATEAAIDVQVNDVCDLVKGYAAALLLLSGHHQYKRQWRKQRERT